MTALQEATLKELSDEIESRVENGSAVAAIVVTVHVAEDRERESVVTMVGPKETLNYILDQLKLGLLTPGRMETRDSES